MAWYGRGPCHGERDPAQYDVLMRSRATTGTLRAAALLCMALATPGCAPRETLSLHNAGDDRVRVDIAMPWPSYQPFTDARHYSVTLAPSERWSTRHALPEDATKFEIQPTGRAVIRVRSASLSSPTTHEYLIDFASTRHASITLERTGDTIRAFLTESDGAPIELRPDTHRRFREQ